MFLAAAGAVAVPGEGGMGFASPGGLSVPPTAVGLHLLGVTGVLLLRRAGSSGQKCRDLPLCLQHPVARWVSVPDASVCKEHAKTIHSWGGDEVILKCL